MKKAIIFLLILTSGSGWEAFSQTALVLQMNVQRIPVMGARGNKCTSQRVFLLSQGNRMQIRTSDDTLQLKRVETLLSEHGHSIAMYYDELHGNQSYRVRYLKGKKGIILYLNPYVHSEMNVRIKPDRKPLYAIVIKTLPCND